MFKVMHQPTDQLCKQVEILPYLPFFKQNRLGYDPEITSLLMICPTKIFENTYVPKKNPESKIDKIIVSEMFPAVNSTAIETRIQTLRFDFFLSITNSTDTPTPSRGVNLFPPNFG